MTPDMKALWIPSPFHWNGRQGHLVERIVIHATAGGSSAQGIAGWFQNPQAQVSAHYIIGQDGTIVQTVSEDDAAWANGVLTAGHASFWNESVNPNLITVSIEHVKSSTDNSNPLTLAQQEASFGLIERICQRHNLVGNASTVVSHASVDPQNRSECPGNYPWAELFTYLNQGVATMRVPSGWSDDGTTLTAPNGFKVVRGFREYILNNSWDESDLPLTNEYAASHLELSNTGLGGGTQQIFRFSMLGWTQARGVFKEWTGQEILKLRSLLHP